MNILVTGAGAPGIMGTLYSLRNNPDNLGVKITGIDMNPDAVGRSLLDSFYVVPRPESEEYFGKILDICRKESIDVIVPQTTREIEFYSANIGSFLEVGIKVLVATREAISIANNKLDTIKLFEKLSLPVPEYVRVKNLQEFEKGYEKLSDSGRIPVVAKAPFGNGMRGLRVVKNDPWNVDRFLNEKPSGVEVSKEDFVSYFKKGDWPELIICEYLPGDEYSVDAFIGEKVKIAIPRKRAQIRSGISFVTEIDLSQEDMIKQTLCVADQIGLKGVFGFQFKMDSMGIPKVLECNPRIQGTMVASVMAGANVIWFSLKELMGEVVTHKPEVIDNMIFRRYWGGVMNIGSSVLKT